MVKINTDLQTLLEQMLLPYWTLQSGEFTQIYWRNQRKPQTLQNLACPKYQNLD